MTSNRCITVKNILSRGSIESSACCEFTVLFSVVFCLVKPEHKFDFSLVINRLPNKRKLADSARRSATKIYSDITNMVRFLSRSWPEVTGPHPRCQGQSCSHHSWRVRFTEAMKNFYGTIRRYITEDHNV